MGVVYEALDRDKQLRVALKTVRAIDPQYLLRLKSEFRTLQGIEHPNLVTLFDLQSHEGTWFFTMELVEGQSLIQYVRGNAPAATITERTTQADPDPDTQPVWNVTTAPQSSGPIRGQPLYDEAKLRASFAQLALGLGELHRAGKVHRDVKPPNVLCTPGGRVVLLDFGLVTTSDEPRSSSHVVGTVLYMAPEQAAGMRPGPEADWYAVGVMLYEALTGRLPFEGSMMQVLHDKQTQRPLSPGLFVECATDLEDLCMQLLDAEPRHRPDLEAILAKLGAESARERGSSNALIAGSVFVGRDRELAALDAAFEQTRLGRGMIVAVEGQSGVGKSALVQYWTRAVAERVADVVVLSGKYYERETVPYRAFDGVMDALARFLMRQEAAVADSMLPVDVGLLASLFPALRAVESVSRGTMKPPALDPHELRQKLFAAVRELFRRLAQRRPLVLVVDDVQWSDADSRAIFAEAMRAPDGPPVLFLATLRSVPGQEAATERVLQYLRSVNTLQHLSLAPLAPTEAKELATRLLGRQREALAATIAGEAEGHPLFIDALVRHALIADEAVGSGAPRPTTLRLDEALGATVDRLDPEARLVIELVALSLSPLVHEVARRAAGLEHAALPRVLTALRSVHLVRGARLRDDDAIEPYHDRVREVVLQSLSAEQKAQRHEALARVLEAGDRADPEELFAHFSAANSRERALHYAALAASKASDALAFDRAARLYGAALALGPDAEARHKLIIKLGDAHAAAGHGKKAARAFLEAVAEAPADEALELRRRAAEQLLRSGAIDEGLAEVRGVLAAVGLGMPATPRRALVAFLWNRARLALRGLAFKERRPSEIASSDLMRIDVCWSVAGVLSMVDTIRGANFQAIHLRLALGAGEAGRVARALAVETGYSATVGSAAAARTAEIFAIATALSERVATPYAIGMVRGCGGVACGLEGRWRECHALTAEAEEIFRSKCGNIAWELSTFQFFHVYALAFTGRLAELTARVPRLLREAEERGDRYGQNAHRLALGNLAWLVLGDVDGARRAAHENVIPWNEGAFKVEHFWQLLALGQLELYAGNDAAAVQVVEERWSALAGSLLLRVELTRLEAVHLRGRVALAQARHDPAAHAALIKRAAQQAKQILGGGATWAHGLAHLLTAGVQALRGERDAALATLIEAERTLLLADLHLYAAAARARMGELTGGDVGKARIDAAYAWLRNEKVAEPERMVAMLAPGFEVTAVVKAKATSRGR